MIMDKATTDSVAGDSATATETAADETTDETTAETITRDDIASKLHELAGSLSFLDTKESPISQNSAKALAAIAGFVAVYFFGWRRGRRNKTVVEVRRI